MRAVTRLCFEPMEPSLIPFEVELVDLTDIRGTYCYCRRESLAAIGEKLKKRKSRGLTLIGIGNYHYVTYLLISELNLPFTLVIFDYHADLFPTPCPEVISCGSWVYEAVRKLPLLKKVVLIGVNDELVPFIPAKIRRQVAVFPCRQKTWENKNAVLAAIPTENVYFSVDKDVLSESDAITDWDQGTMRLWQLLELLQHIASKKRVCGMDICGEYPWDFVHKKRTALKINMLADSKIIRAVVQASADVKAG
ncbi:MAG TPA: arginase family protein [Bacillota bacterium]|nr:arginase family protein [Bacillota bacterium]